MKRPERNNSAIIGVVSSVARAKTLLIARESAAVAFIDIDAEMGVETAKMII